MKKYEAPMVELTKFDVEDVIATSAMNLDEAGKAAAVADIKAYAANPANAGSEDASYDGVFSW